MFRRTYIKVLPSLSVLPFFSKSKTPEPRLPADGNLMFWYYFYSAITKRAMSTARSREYVVKEELQIESVTEQEAIRALELANAGYFTLNDIPAKWREYFNQVETEFQGRG